MRLTVGKIAFTGVTAAALLTLVPAVSAAAPPTPQYRLVDLGQLGAGPSGARFSDPAALNDAGVVVGSSTHSGDSGLHGFRWKAGTLTDLGTGLPGGDSAATAVNASGVIAGGSNVIDPYTHPHAVTWTNGRLTDLGTGYGKGSGSYAYGVNDTGTVVGIHYRSASAVFRAALWSQGKVRDLGTLGGSSSDPYATDSEAHAVNDAGQVVGDALPSSGYPLHGFIWQKGVMRDLGNLGGSREATVGSAISAAGLVAGFSQRADGETHGFMWRDGSMRDLGSLGPDFYYRASYADGINDSGTVVGSARVSGGAYGHRVATVWRNGTLTDLNTVVPVPAGRRLSIAFAINKSGMIVARSCEISSCETDGGTESAVLLVPVS